MQNDNGDNAAHKPTPLQALGMLGGVMLLIGGYMTLLGMLHNLEFYAGFVFLLCWMVIEQGRLDRLPHAILGAAFGLALGIALKLLIAKFGATGGTLFGLLVLPILFCQFLGWLPLLINMTTMTFLLVVTIPHVQGHADFTAAAVSLLVGIVYFGLLLGGGRWLWAKRSAGETAKTAAR